MFSMWWIVIGLGIFTTLVIIAYTFIKDDYFDCFLKSIVIGVLLGITSIFVVLSVELPKSAERQRDRFLMTKQMVLEIVAESENYQDYGITSKIIELNEWLVSAKESKKNLGNWSPYYAIDLEELKPITLKGE